MSEPLNTEYRVDVVECHGGEKLVSLIGHHGRHGDDFTPDGARALAFELIRAADEIDPKPKLFRNWCENCQMPSPESDLLIVCSRCLEPLP